MADEILPGVAEFRVLTLPFTAHDWFDANYDVIWWTKMNKNTGKWEENVFNIIRGFGYKASFMLFNHAIYN